MKVSVIIVSYNARHYLWQCLDAVHRAGQRVETEVWVVDNASSDGAIDYVRPDFPDVHYIENIENVGFARANNMAIRQSQGDLVLLLNPDTIIAEDTLMRCVAFFDKHPQAGAIGTMMLNRDGSYARESKRGLPTPFTALCKMSGLCTMFPTHPRLAHYYMGHLPQQGEGKIEVISGAFMMLRRDALEQAGLLDEDYFMYGEDIDMSYRILQAGWKNWYVPYPILHYKGESTQKTSFRYVHNFHNAMIIFFRKHFARRYRLTAKLVNTAVVMKGSAVMLYKWMHIGSKMVMRWTKMAALWEQRKRQAETLLFEGTDEGWEAVRSICQRAGIEPCFKSCMKSADQQRDFTYVAFEVTTDGQPYKHMLREIAKRHNNGLKGVLGTYHPHTNLLILPNAILA